MVLPLDRAILVEWMLEVLDQFENHMCLRTPYLAAALVDEFLERAAADHHIELRSGADIGVSLGTGEFYLGLLGATCLHIASKCEDVSYIGIRDLSVHSPARV